jgi:tRNA threonylcarbamoyl adenosine modification protein YeaZ
MTEKSTILAIEAAVAGGSLSLWRGGSELGFWIGDEKVARAENLLPNIDMLLKNNDCTQRELGLIAVSAGPGSFTGIRVGFATALGLSRGLGTKMSSVSLLSAMIHSRKQSGEAVIAAIPMGRNSVCISHTGAPAFVGDIEPRTEPEEDFIREVESSGCAAILHQNLYEQTDRSPALIDAGKNMATYIGAYCSVYRDSTSLPLFISKSF